MSTPSPGDNGKTVLVVDDEADIRFLLRLGLERLGYKVLEAASAEEALDLLTVSHADVLVMDLKLPGMDGFALLDALRDGGRLADLPVAVLSGRDDVDTQQRAMELGARAYLTKPVPPEQLGAVIVDLLQGTPA